VTDPAARPLPAPASPCCARSVAARVELLREIEIVDEYGERRQHPHPAERPLTVFVDKRELVTLMTLGACARVAGAGLPAQPAPGRQRRRRRVDQVDWDVGAAAVRTRAPASPASRNARRSAW
jgi:FdhD protein